MSVNNALIQLVKEGCDTIEVHLSQITPATIASMFDVSCEETN